MKRAAWWFVALWPAISPAADELTIATYNVENYVSTNRMTAMGYRKDYPKSETSKQALRAVIQRLDVDVLVMQEMGPPPYLEELQRDLAAQGMDYPHAVLLQGPDTDRHVAVLSRRPLVRAVQHTGLVFKYHGGYEAVKRGVLEVEVATPLGPLTLWGLHLKSRYTDEDTDPESAKRRAGEAMAVREFILKQIGDPAEALFVILGDFNDSKASAPLRYLTRKGKMHFAKLLPAADASGDRWTYHYRKEDAYSRVDHVLVSAPLWHAVKDGRATIFDGDDVRAASDHRPVVFTLEFGYTQTQTATNQTTAATNATAND
ncbi:MAG: endonuclease/exonuclease/phosphatase family protein [Cephaloticoccus sp.]|nr:endonuclease/exonuclease/phosphatase family protein [Cephaloticoccus sp.]